MAYYDITYKCGHTDRVQIYGTNVHGECERKAAWYATILCPDCKRKTYENANEAAAQWCAAHDCVKLRGSVRQVAWAENIRAKVIEGYELLYADIPEDAPQEYKTDISEKLRQFKSEDRANWWIECRDWPDCLRGRERAEQN